MRARTAEAFKARLRAREPLLGTFVKTPHPAIIEVLATTALDCICLDAEHAPFDRGTLDVCLLAARAGGLPALVRTPSGAAHEILNALDLGAAGVIIPHICSASQAASAVHAAHYGAGGRGYAGATRSTGFIAPKIDQRLLSAQSETSVIVQIEDVEALAEAAAIAATPGVDSVFIGRVDLTVALGETDLKSAAVVKAVEQVTRDAIGRDTAVGMFTADLAELPRWRALGASLFLLGSDQGFLRSGADSLRREFGPGPSE